MGTLSTIRCTSCGTERPQTARYCARCGAAQDRDIAAPRGQRPPRGWIVVAIALLIVGLAGATTLDDVPSPWSSGRPGPVLDATVDVDARDLPPRTDGPAGTTQGAAPGTTTDAEQATAPVSCRRSDRGRSSCGPVLSVGADSAGIIVLLREDLAVVASADELMAIDLDDGEGRWRTRAFDGARSVRAVDDGELMIAAVAGGLVAVEVATGVIAWSAAFADAAPTEAASDQPVPAGTTSIAPVPVWAGDGGVLARDPAGRLHAFDRQDGTRRWVRTVDAGSAVATTRGLVTIGRDGLRLWHPDDPDPRWQRSGSDLHLHAVVGGATAARPAEVVASPLPLVSGRWLVDLDGGTRPLPSTGPVEVALAGGLTVVITWPGDEAVADGRRAGRAQATITAFDADGHPRWRHDAIPLPCCTARAVPTAGPQLTVTSGRGDGSREEQVVILDTADGGTVEVIRRDGATIAAVTAGTVVWREGGRLVGIDRRTGREAFRATGTLVSVDPLLIEGPMRTIVVRPGGPIAPSDVARPGPRRDPALSGGQGRGTAS